MLEIIQAEGELEGAPLEEATPTLASETEQAADSGDRQLAMLGSGPADMLQAAEMALPPSQPMTTLPSSAVSSSAATGAGLGISTSTLLAGAALATVVVAAAASGGSGSSPGTTGTTPVNTAFSINSVNHTAQGLSIAITVPSGAQAGDVVSVDAVNTTTNVHTSFSYTLTATDITSKSATVSVPVQSVDAFTVAVTLNTAAGGITLGNGSMAAPALPAPPAAPTASLNNDTGLQPADRITTDGTIKLTGLGTGATLETSLDGGTTWAAAPLGTGGTVALTGLTDGSYSVMVRQTVGGSTSASSNTLNFTIDTTAPSAPTALLATDSGTVGDRLTNNGALNVFAEQGARVEYRLQNVTAGTAVSAWTVAAGSNGQYTVPTPAGTANGDSYLVEVRQTDVAGNVSTTFQTVTYTLDNSAPQAPLVALLDNIGTPTAPVSLTGTLNVTGLEAGAKVEYSTDNGSTWTGTFSAIGGPNTVLVRQTDAAGNVSASSAFTFDRPGTSAAPTVALLNDTGVLPGDKVTNDATLSVTGLATGLTPEYSVDNGATWSATAAIQEGLNTVLIRGNNGAGSVSLASTIQFTYYSATAASTQQPVIQLVNDTGIVGDGITTDGRISATMPGNKPGTYLFSTDGGTSWKSTFSPQTGTNTVLAQQIDIAGNLSAPSAPFTFTLSGTVPALSSASLLNDTGNPADGITSNAALNVVGLAAGFQVQYSTDNGLTWSTPTSLDVNNNFTPSTLTQGTVNLLLRQIDPANPANPSAAIAVPAFTLDQTAPGVPVLSAAQTTGLVAPQLTIPVTLPNGAALNDQLTVQVLDSTQTAIQTLQHTVTQTDLTSGTVTLLTSGASPASGVYSVSAVLTDVAGNAGQAGTAANISFDTTASNPPALLATDIGAQTVGNANPRTAHVTLPAGTGFAAVSVGDLVTVSFSPAGQIGTAPTTYTYAVQAADLSGGQVSIPVGLGLTSGSYDVTATLTDAFGNTSSPSTSFVYTVDTIPPSAPTAIALGYTPSATAGQTGAVSVTLTLPADAVAGDTVSVVIAGGATSQTIPYTVLGSEPNGLVSLPVSGLTSGTSYTASASLTDVAGNLGQAASSAAMTFDLIPPGTPAVTLSQTASGLAGQPGTVAATITLPANAVAGDLVSITVTGGNTTQTLPTYTVLGTEPNGQVSLPVSGLSSGVSYTVAAAVTDAAGNLGLAGASTPQSFDLVPPGTPAVALGYTPSATAGQPGTTAVTVTLPGNAVAGDVVSVIVTDGTTPQTLQPYTVLGTETNAQVVLPVSGLASGTSYTALASLTDAAGNIGLSGSSAPLALDAIAPSAPSAVTMSYAASAQANTAGLISVNLTLPVDAVAGDMVSIVVSDGVTPPQTLAYTVLGTEPNGQVSVPISGLAGGVPYTATASLTDAAGNIGTGTASTAQSFDLIAPSAPIAVALNYTASATAGQPGSVAASLTLPADAVAGDTVSVVVTDGTTPQTLIYTVLGTELNGQALLPVTGLNSGATYTATAALTDAAGNLGLSASSTPLALDMVAPGLAVLALGYTASGIAGQAGTGSVTITLPGNAVAGDVVSVIVTDGTTQQTLQPYTVLGTEVNAQVVLPMSGLVSGTSYTASASLTDAAGNVGQTATSAAMTFDTVAPSAPTAVGLSYVASATAGQPGTVSVTVSLPPDAVAGDTVAVALFDGTNTLTLPAYTVLGNEVNGQVSLPATGLTSGTSYTASVSITDAAGNLGLTAVSAAQGFDLLAPSAPTAVALTYTPSGLAGQPGTVSADITLPADAVAGDTLTVVVTDGITSQTLPYTVLAADLTANGGTGIVLLPVTGLTHATSYTATASLTDAAGNLGLSTLSQALVLDSVALAPTLALTNDTGASATDNITSNPALNAPGGAEPGALIEYSVDNGATWTNVVPTFGADQAYTVLVRQTDVAGNISNSGSLTFTLDTAGPINAPGLALVTDSYLPNDGITNVAVLAAPTGVDPGATAEYSTDNGTTWSATAPTFTLDGPYIVLIRQVDVAGNPSPVGMLGFTLDTVAPIPTSGLNISGISGTAGPNTSSISFPAPTSDTANATTTLALLDGAGAVVAGVTPTFDPIARQYTFTGLNDGTYSVRATLTDQAGNATAITSQTVSVVSGTGVAPVVVVTDSGTPDPAAAVTNTPVLTVTVQNPTTTDVSYSLDGGLTWSAAVAVTAGSATLNLAGLLGPDGSKNILVRELDAIAVTFSASTSVNLVLDTTLLAPTATFVDSGVSLIDTITSNGVVTISGLDANLAALTCDITGTNAAGQPIAPITAQAVTVTPGAMSATLDLNALVGNGTYAVVFTQTDKAGNTPVTATVASITLDTLAPQAPLAAFTDTGASQTDGITSNSVVTVSGIDAQVDSVGYSITGGALGAALTGTLAAGTTTLDLKAAPLSLQDGTYTVVFTQTDLAGNVSAASVAQVITLDTTAPTAPMGALVNDTGSSTTDGVTNDGRITVTGLDPTATALSVDIQNAGGNIQTLSIPFTPGAASTIFDLAGLVVDGSYTLTFNQTDAAGNVTPGPNPTLALTLDRAVPTASVINNFAVNTNSLAMDASITLSGTAQVGDVLNLALINATTATTQPFTHTLTQAEITTGSLTYSFPPAALASGNTYTVSVSTTDLAGNVQTQAAASSGAVVYSAVDTTAPATPSMAPAVYNPVSATNPNPTLDVVVNIPAAAGSPTAPLPGDLLRVSITDALGTITTLPDVSLVQGNIGTTATVTTPVTGMNGAYTLSAVLIDQAGNISTAAAGLQVSLDTLAPAQPTLALVNDTGTSAIDKLTNDGTVSVTGIEAGGALNYRYYLQNGVAPGWSTATVPNGQTTTQILLPGLVTDPTAYIVETQVRDAAGNVSAIGSTTFSFDNTAPVAPALQATTAAVGATSFSLAIPTAQASVGDVMEVTVTSGASSVVVTLPALVTTTGSVTVDLAGTAFSAGLTQGTYSVAARLIDPAGNFSNPTVSPASLTVGTVTGPTPATFAFTDTGSVGDQVTKLTNALTVASTDPAATVTYSWDNAAPATWSTTYNTTYPTTDGLHTLYVRQTDANNNVTTNSFSYTLDRTAPGNPIAHLTTDSGQLPADNVSNVNSVTVTGLDANVSEVWYVLSGLAPNGQAYNGTWTKAANLAPGATSMTLSAPAFNLGSADANWSLSLFQSDKAGNGVLRQISTGLTGSDGLGNAFQFTLDTAAPAAPLAALANGNTITDPITGGLITDDPRLNVSAVLATDLLEFSTDANGPIPHWSRIDQYSSASLIYGQLNNVWIRETDAAGNVSAVDPNAPTIAIQYTAPGGAPVSLALSADTGAGSDSGLVNAAGLAPLLTAAAPFSTDHVTNTPAITFSNIDPNATLVEYVVNQTGPVVATGTWNAFKYWDPNAGAVPAATLPTNNTSYLLTDPTGVTLMGEGQYEVAIIQTVGGTKSAVTSFNLTVDTTAPSHGMGSLAVGGTVSTAQTDASELFLPANGVLAPATAVLRVTYNEAVFDIAGLGASGFSSHLLQTIDPVTPLLTPVTANYTVQVVNSGMSRDGTTVLGVRPNAANPSGVEDVVEIIFTETQQGIGSFGATWTGPTTATANIVPVAEVYLSDQAGNVTPQAGNGALIDFNTISWQNVYLLP